MGCRLGYDANVYATIRTLFPLHTEQPVAMPDSAWERFGKRVPVPVEVPSERFMTNTVTLPSI